MSVRAPIPFAAIAGALVVISPGPVIAQDKPTAAVMAALVGAWTFDVERSEPLADNPLAIEAMRLRPEGAGGAPAGGGGRRGGGGGGGAAILRNPYLRELVTQLQPPGVLVVGLTETTADLGTTDGEPITWTTDGKKRQKAQLDGTLLEFSGRWRGAKLILVDAVSGTAELKRELHVIENGQALEMKIELSGPGFPKKLERKVVFTRN